MTDGHSCDFGGTMAWSALGSDTCVTLPEALNLPLASLRLCERNFIAEIDKNLSGVVVDERTGNLILSVNWPERILLYNPNTNSVERTVWKEDVLPLLRDAEGVAWLGPNDERDGAYEFAIVEESASRRIVIFDADTFEPTGETYDIDVNIEFNLGLEGITYDRTRRIFYAVQEKSPMRIVAVSRASGGGSLPTQEIIVDDQDQLRDVGLTDLAGVAYVNGGGSGALLLLSHEQKRVVLMDIDTRAFGEERLSVGGIQPEGVAYDASKAILYIAGEPNELMTFCHDEGGGFAADAKSLVGKQRESAATVDTIPEETSSSSSPSDDDNTECIQNFNRRKCLRVLEKVSDLAATQQEDPFELLNLPQVDEMDQLCSRRKMRRRICRKWKTLKNLREAEVVVDDDDDDDDVDVDVDDDETAEEVLQEEETTAEVVRRGDDQSSRRGNSRGGGRGMPRRNDT